MMPGEEAAYVVMINTARPPTIGGAPGRIRTDYIRITKPAFSLMNFGCENLLLDVRDTLLLDELVHLEG